MTDIFYFFGFLLFIMIFPSSINYKFMAKIMRSHMSVFSLENIPTYISMLCYAISISLFILWCMLGLLSNNWLFFLTVILLYLIVSKLIGGRKNFSPIRTIFQMTLSVLISMSSLFIALNHFYFKYDIESILYK